MARTQKRSDSTKHTESTIQPIRPRAKQPTGLTTKQVYTDREPCVRDSTQPDRTNHVKHDRSTGRSDEPT